MQYIIHLFLSTGIRILSIYSLFIVIFVHCIHKNTGSLVYCLYYYPLDDEYYSCYHTTIKSAPQRDAKRRNEK